ncbi:MAG: hypothetical protein DRH50_15345 [Deltaproteobacteria bacterium]|nr:MAG: hypothetical protein DRH50_15345 [Deltaproteobacteria bacterium]
MEIRNSEFEIILVPGSDALRRNSLPTPYCLLPTPYCLLPTAYCLLPTLSRIRSAMSLILSISP